MLLGWESVRGLRVDPKLRHVTLVYEPFDTPPKPRVLRLFRKPAAVSTPHITPLLSCNFLTLNRLEPAVVAGIVETVEHFAPSVKREPLPGQNALRWLSIVLLTIAGVVLFVVLLATYFRIRRLGRP